MKWNIGQFERELGGNGRNLPPFVLIYGEDGGKTNTLAKKCALSVCPHLDDPFAVDRLRAEDILDDATRLVDSANTISMSANRRLVYIEGVSSSLGANQLSKIAESVENALGALNDGCVIVMALGGVDNKNAIVKMVEKHPQATALRCFVSSSRDLTTEITSYFSKLGKRVEPSAMAFLQDNLGNDGEITQRELEVLSLYVGHADVVTVEDCLETISSAPSLNVFKLCDALGSRDRAKVDTYLRMLEEEGQDASMISAVVLRHLKRLMQAQAAMASGMSADSAMKSLKPAVFYGQREFEQQMRTYPKARLEKMAEKFYEMTLESRQGVLPADLVINRALMGFSF